MTPVCTHVVDHPSAWTPATLGGKDGLKLALSDEELDAIETLLARTRHKRPQEATRADFDHPVVDRLMRTRPRRDHGRPRHPDRQRRDARAVQRGAVRAHLLGLGHAPGRRCRAKRQRRPPGLRAEQPEGRGQARLPQPARAPHAHGLLRDRRAHVRAPREVGRLERPGAEPVDPQRDPAHAARAAGAALPRIPHRERGGALLEQGDHRRSDARVLLRRRQAVVHVRAVAHEERGGDAGRHAGRSRGSARRTSTRSPTARTWRCASCSSPAT